MAINIRQLHPNFAAEVSGIDISRPLTPSEAAAIEAGMDRHAVLVFRDQPLTDDQQIDFSQNFGTIEVTLARQMAKPGDARLREEMGDISNLDANNRLRARDDCPPPLRAGQPPLARRRLLPRRGRQILPALRPHRPRLRRQHRIRRHARRLRRAGPKNQSRKSKISSPNTPSPSPAANSASRISTANTARN